MSECENCEIIKAKTNWILLLMVALAAVCLLLGYLGGKQTALDSTAEEFLLEHCVVNDKTIADYYIECKERTDETELMQNLKNFTTK